MNDSKETLDQIKEPEPVIDNGSILQRVEELELRCNQLETDMKEAVTFDTLADRIIGKKIVKKRRVKRDWSPEEKAAFHARMVAARQAKENARQQATKAEAMKK